MIYVSVDQLRKALDQLGDAEIAAHSQRFFKTAKGEYGEGDVFLGIRVPVLRSFIRDCRAFSLEQVVELLHSERHEERLLAVLLMVDRFERAKKFPDAQYDVYRCYLENTAYINNWDIVDASAHKIVGAWLGDKNDRNILYQFIESDDLWQRRIAIIATLAFIRNHDYKDAIKISELVLQDKEDLIHKASGWMLREIGKRDEASLIGFLNQYSKIMPRTMLRYAIERLEKKQRKFYLE